MSGWRPGDWGWGTLVGSLSRPQGASAGNLMCAALDLCDMFLGSCENFFLTILCGCSFLCGLFIFSAPLCKDCLTDRGTSFSIVF